MTELQHDEYVPAMRDTRDMTTGDSQRKVAQEATLQLKMCRGNIERARAATERYAITLGLGKNAVRKTVLGSPAALTDLPIN